MTIPILPGFYSNLLSSFFGGISSQEQQEIWDRFVQNNGVTASTPDTDALKQKFSEHVQGTFVRRAEREAFLELSPREIKARISLFESINEISKMLATIQNAVAVQAGALIFYGGLQEEYTKMMSRVPTYGPASDAGSVVTNSDPSKFTFGYNKVTLQEVIEWGVSTAKQQGTAVFGSRNYPTGEYSFRKVSDPDGTERIEMKFARNAFQFFDIYNKNFPRGGDVISQFIYETAISNNLIAPPGFSFIYPNTPIVDITSIPEITQSVVTYSPTTTTPSYTTFDTQVARASSLWSTMLNPHLATLNGARGIPGTLTSHYSWLSEDDKDRESKQRSEINARLQQYVENTRVVRDTVRDAISQQQSTLNQSRESLSSMTNLLTSMIESIEDLMKTIFRGR
jgi:hypothetical protein